MNRRLVLTLSGVMIALASLAAGCSSGTEADPTPVKTFKITPASSTRTPAPATSPTATSGAATAAATPSDATTATAGAGAATTLDLVGLNILFDKTELTASPGTATIRFNNKDGGIPHNVHVFKGTSASGESVGTTAIEVGPVEQELKLTLEAGTYFYQCDAHPATMTGKLTVK